MGNQPIFIGGPDRCGKTTLRAFLVSHPNISIPAVGSNMWTYFYGQFGDLGRRNNLERCLAAMLRYKHVRFLEPDPGRIQREFWQGEPTYGRLFALFQEHHAEREGKPRWGDQTGLIERYADLIFTAYPGAKMIHMIRDPRDRYEASLALWPNGRGRGGGATARWLYSVDLVKRNLKRYPDRYKVVRFETLVHQPEETLRDVCSFLGEEYTPAMLTMEGAPKHRDKLSQGCNGQPGQCPLSAKFIGRFQQTIPKREVMFMQMIARRDMLAYGYAPEQLQFSFKDWLLFSCNDWPLNLARMLAWRTLETMQHKFPSLMGRKPARRMIVK
jgi:hypothetical protein